MKSIEIPLSIGNREANASQLTTHLLTMIKSMFITLKPKMGILRGLVCLDLLPVLELNAQWCSSSPLQEITEL